MEIMVKLILCTIILSQPIRMIESFMITFMSITVWLLKPAWLCRIVCSLILLEPIMLSRSIHILHGIQPRHHCTRILLHQSAEFQLFRLLIWHHPFWIYSILMSLVMMILMLKGNRSHGVIGVSIIVISLWTFPYHFLIVTLQLSHWELR